MIDAELKKWVISITDRELDDLTVSLDYDTDPSEVFPVLMYVPIRKHGDHGHIALDREQARTLRDWLTAYLNLDPQDYDRR